MKKRVLHIALPRGGGGVDVYIRSIFKHTPDDIENILVCASDFGNGNFPANCRVKIINIPREVSLKEDFSAVKEIRKIITDEKPDVIYCHSSMAGAVGRIASLGSGITLIYNPHGWSFDIQNKSSVSRLAFYFIEKTLACFTKQIICISDYEKNVALKKRICNENKLTVIRNGIDLEKGKNLSDTSDKNFFTIGCSARISQQKAPLLFAEVMGIVAKKEPSARFVWIGDGDMHDEFQNALREKNIDKVTKITGWVSDPEKYISGMDIGVLFSEWEGFGLSLVDYMVQGKPIVTVNVGGIPEIVTDDVGILLKTRNPEDIAEAVLSLRDSDKRKKMSVACLNRAEKFDVKNTAEKTWELIRSIS